MKLITIKKSTEQWLDYPVATIPESEKLVTAVTDISKYGVSHQANLYRKASLHAVDRFFERLTSFGLIRAFIFVRVECITKLE